MKTFPLLTAGLALLSMGLTQCAYESVPSESGPGSYGAGYGADYYGGYGATGRVVTNAMWAGTAAYGIHERNETRQNRVNYGVNSYHRSGGSAYRGGGGGYRGGGGGRR